MQAELRGQQGDLRVTGDKSHMSIIQATGRAWRTALVAVVSTGLLAALLILGASPERASAQDPITCYAIADSNQPGNLNSEGEVDTLVRISNAVGAPVVQVIGGNGGLGTGDAEALAIRPLPDGTFQMHGWESGLNLFTIDPDTAATSGGPFSIPGKVEGLTWSGTDDADASNDLLWASYGSPANQVAAYSATGALAAGPLTVESGALNSIVDIAWDQTTDQVFAIITDVTDVTSLITINPANGAASVVGGTDIDMEGLGFASSGQLVGTTGNDGANAFHLVNKANGAASLQSDLSAITGAFDFESVDCERTSVVIPPPPPTPVPPPLPALSSVCYAIADSVSAAVGDQNSPDTLVRIDTALGSATVVGQLDNGATVSVEAFAIRPGTGLYGFDPDTAGGRLFLIDENTAAVTVIATGLSALGDVDGMTFSGIADGDPGNDVLWMSIRNVGAPSDQLVSVDPATGAILSGPLTMDASGIPGITVNDIDAIAWDPVTGVVFGTAGSGEANSLVSINPASGAVTNVGDFGINDIEGLGFSNVGADNGFLFATTGKEDGDAASALYLINKANPAASQLVLDLNSATGVTDFESVDCLSLAGPPVADGAISATLVAECVGNAGKLSVTVTHESGSPVDYSVVITGQPASTGAISAGDAPEMVMTDPNLPDGTYAVTVTNESTQTVVLNEQAPIDCVEQAVLSATVTGTCEAGAGKLTANLEYVSGNTEAVFSVSVTNQPDQTVTLAGVGTEMVMYSGLADGLYDVLVTGDGALLTAVQRNVVCGEAGIDIELAVNGEDADNPTGPLVAVGEDVVFTYVVTNNGEVDLTNVQVTDSVLGAITCPENALAVGESMECTLTGVAQVGQYGSTATVTGTPASGPAVVDEDPTNYLGANVSIDIEKSVNGVDADDTPGPVIVVGETVTFEYVVVNDGNVPLTNVVVTDSVAGVIACPATSLDAGASMVCEITEIAVAGQQSMSAEATGDGPGALTASDVDAGNYFGEGSGITIVTTTNGVDGVVLSPGDSITWEYVVTNIGNTTVSNVTVTDDQLGVIDCPQDQLLAGEAMTCTVTGTAGLGEYNNLGSVAGVSETGTSVSASDPSSYSAVPAGIGDQVWVDLNENCSQDPGEPGVAGLEVTLWVDTDGDGAPDDAVATTTTDAAGLYLFSGTDSTADYIVQFGAAAGSYTCQDVGGDEIDSDADPATGITGTNQVPSGMANLTVDAGLLPASLGDTVFIDSNDDGQQSAGEAGVSGIVVNLWIDNNGDGAPDDQVATTTTDANGTYSFEGLDPQQTYIVQFVSDGRVFTVGNQGDDATDSDAGPDGITGTYDLAYGEDNTSVDAGLVDDAPGSISGVLFEDVDGSGTPSPGEAIAGATVKLINTAGDVVDTMTTDADGAYTFAMLAAGDYNVMVDSATVPAGLIHVIDREGDADEMSPEALDNGEIVTDVDFGYIACASIGDFVFSDLNGDGIQDAGEPGVAGVTINLWIVDAQGAPVTEVATTTSDSIGSYGFDCVDPREDYVIQVTGAAASALTIQGAGNDPAVDSDIGMSGLSGIISLDPGVTNDTIDVGLAGGVASIDIETLTNMIDADAPGSGPVVGEGSTVIWTYIVMNDGGVDLTNVQVVDSQLGELCLFDMLAAGATETCTTSALAGAAGSSYENTGSVSGLPVSGGAAVVDEDPTNHSVTAGEVASIMIQTLTMGSDGPSLTVGSIATIEYSVANNGNVALTGVVVTDSAGIAVACPTDTLAAGEGMICFGQVVVAAGVFTNSGSVTGTAPDGTTVVSASDPTSHTGLVAGMTVVTTPSTGHLVTASGITPISSNFTPPNPSGTLASGTGSGATASPLAMTGSNSMEMAFIAVGAILAGCAFVALSRRRELGDS